MTQHQNNVGYFAKMAAKAKNLAERLYWLGRKEGKEAMDKQVAADAEAKRKLAQRDANLNDFNTKSAPSITLESKHPNGCVVYWKPPKDWQPDTYIVLVKDSPFADWRSVASSNINFQTRSQVLTKSYLAWGEYKEPYYIAVAAVKSGVGRKVSETLIYPPDSRVNVAATPKTFYYADKPEPAVKIDHLPEEPVEGAQTGEFKPTQADLDKARATEIIGAIRTYTGRRTRKGRPYIGDFRKHLPLNPRVGYKELRKHWKMLNSAPTGD